MTKNDLTPLSSANLIYMTAADVKLRSYYSPWDGMMVINTNKPNSPGHEFGHMMGNSLHYDSEHAGYENNVMIKSSGIVEPINIREAISRWGGWNLATWEQSVNE